MAFEKTTLRNINKPNKTIELIRKIEKIESLGKIGRDEQVISIPMSAPTEVTTEVKLPWSYR